MCPAPARSAGRRFVQSGRLTSPIRIGPQVRRTGAGHPALRDATMSDTDRSIDASVLRLGSYRLVAPLGSGGMSSVYRAVHEQTGHEVAIKVLPRYLAKNAVLLQRFLREAQN